MIRSKHIAMCSFGKDSLATILLALEHNEPLDEALFVEVMFDKDRGISGEVPEHIEWVKDYAIPLLANMGVRTKILHSDKDYMYFFTNAVGGGIYKGRLYGFPIAQRCFINRDCKIRPINQYIKGHGNVVQYVGIAADEHKRLARLKGQNKISLLARYGYTESMAKDLCEKYNLLSPIYRTSERNGCWFCPNCKIKDFAMLRKRHPELWSELERLSHTSNLCSYGFKWGMTVQEVEKEMDKYDKKQRDIEIFNKLQLKLWL